MKKLFILFIAIFFVGSSAYASCDFSCSKCCSKQYKSDVKEIKSLLKQYVKYENDKNVDGLNSLYVDDYLTGDAMPKSVYMDIINKTWSKYLLMEHSLEVQKIDINGDFATVVADEVIRGQSEENIEGKIIKGELKSLSSVVYHLEKVQNTWKFVSDYVINEQTVLIFEDAKLLEVKFFSPSRVLQNKDYVATLNIKCIPKNYFVIATIGQEKIIYPHQNAEEVYRKIPANGVLERVFKANKDNLNEYVVATYCLTKPKVTKANKIEPVLMGVGYVINRVNIVPENKFITVKEDGEKEKNNK